MIKKIFFSMFFLIILAGTSFAAGSNSDSGSTESHYDKAVKLIKAAKKLEKKGKTEKAIKSYERAIKFLVTSNKMKPNKAKSHVLSMVQNQAINCHSGKQIPCEIDSVCIHGDNESSLATAISIKNNLIDNGLELKTLTNLRKFK